MRACEGCLNLTTFSLLKEPQILWCLRKTNSCFEDYVQAKTFFSWQNYYNYYSDPGSNNPWNPLAPPVPRQLVPLMCHYHILYMSYSGREGTGSNGRRSGRVAHSLANKVLI